MVESFQTGVDLWMDACFGSVIKADQTERADRFIEEALELVQTMHGFNASRAHALVDYVFNRPVGERTQEVGGVMVTLAALCNAADIDMVLAGERELSRVWTKVEAIRAKQAAKPTGSALPVAMVHAVPADKAEPDLLPVIRAAVHADWLPVDGRIELTQELANLTDADALAEILTRFEVHFADGTLSDLSGKLS